MQWLIERTEVIWQAAITLLSSLERAFRPFTGFSPTNTIREEFMMRLEGVYERSRRRLWVKSGRKRQS